VIIVIKLRCELIFNRIYLPLFIATTLGPIEVFSIFCNVEHLSFSKQYLVISTKSPRNKCNKKVF